MLYSVLRKDARMAVSAHDVAAELRGRYPHLGVVKLHKLLYYIQGWHLTWAGPPMFEQRVEAWRDGPVVGPLWISEKYDPPPSDLRPIEADRMVVIDYVLERYGHRTDVELIQLSHEEAPWKDVYVPGMNAEMTHDSLRRWFEQDADYLSHAAEVERLRQMRDLFAPLKRTSEVEAAVARATSGRRVRDTSPV